MLMDKKEIRKNNMTSSTEDRILHVVNDGGKIGHISYFMNDDGEISAIEYNNYTGAFSVLYWNSIEEYYEDVKKEEWMNEESNIIFQHCKLSILKEDE